MRFLLTAIVTVLGIVNAGALSKVDGDVADAFIMYGENSACHFEPDKLVAAYVQFLLNYAADNGGSKEMFEEGQKSRKGLTLYYLSLPKQQRIAECRKHKRGFYRTFRALESKFKPYDGYKG